MLKIIQSLRAFRRAREWVARYDIVNCTDGVRDGVTIANFLQSLDLIVMASLPPNFPNP